MSYANHILNRLGPEDLAALQPHLRKVALARDEELIPEGGQVATVHFPDTALMINVVPLEEGGLIGTSLVGLESVTGLVPALAGVPSAWRTVVQTAGEAWALPAALLQRQAFVSPPLMNHLLRLTQDAQAQSGQFTACNAVHGATERLARWLLLVDDRSGGRRLLMTQEDAASALGAQRTTVNAAAGVLRDQGAIQYARGRVTVLDRAGLERAACECYGRIQANSAYLGVWPRG